MTCEKDTRIESLLLFFLSIYLFKDFYFGEDRVVLKLRDEDDSNSRRVLLSWFLNSLNLDIESEFFLLSSRTIDPLIEIKCNSHPHIFKKLQEHLKKMLCVENGTQF
ncbi:MAG: hypothetical protein EAX86_10335 [Candidatus Heimdallarchaeota archaeon]|nr:hypothetical protein [Candidatus Heimdallarchaeota archaeon]